MRKEDFTIFSSELLEEKLTKAQTTIKFLIVSIIGMFIIALVMISLNPFFSSFAVFVAILTPLVVFQKQKVKGIKIELAKRMR